MQFVWTDKINGVDDVTAEDINAIGRALQQLINGGLKIPTKLSDLEADKIEGYELLIGASALNISGGSIHVNKTDYGFYVDGNRIQSVGTPENSADAANKGYVDGLVGSVESALDSILAMQNSLIGGDA